jgi:hypothetical protein
MRLLAAILTTLALTAPARPAPPPDPGPEPVRPEPKVFPGGLDTAGNYHPPGTKFIDGRDWDAYQQAMAKWKAAKEAFDKGQGAGPATPKPAPAPSTSAVSPPHAAELRAALADARKIGPALSARTRYLSLLWVPERDRDDWRRVAGDFWPNATSREAELVKARRVTATLLALNGDDYGAVWLAAFDKLGDEDPYFHARLNVGGKVVTSLAPWLPAQEAAELVALTQSPTAILRADWFFSRVAIQAGRKVGYYDLLGVKDRKDFDELIQFDRKKSQGIRREVAGIVARSGVANFPRQIFREQALTGGRWETRDVLDDNADARNAVRQLDQDYKHQAEEIYGFLPNGLFVYFLANADGTRQDSAPDKIGSDKTAPGNDGRIHIGKSCVVCHSEGLRPISDWARRVYNGPISLNSPDPIQLRRLRQIYLGDLQSRLDEDNTAYARSLKKLTGWTTEESAKIVGRLWGAYVEADLLPSDVSQDLGLKEEVYLKRLRDYYAKNQLSDPVLASHIAIPPIPIRRDDYEQLVPIIYPIVLAGDEHVGNGDR